MKAEDLERFAEDLNAFAGIETAVELDPNNPNIHFSFSLFYLRKGLKSDGINEMRQVVSIYPFQARNAYIEWRKYGGSLDDLISIAGASPTGLWHLGVYFEGKKYLAQAREAYLIACKSISARSSFRVLNELSPHVLLPKLLKKLKHYGLDKERDYYKALWKKDLADIDQDEV